MSGTHIHRVLLFVCILALAQSGICQDQKFHFGINAGVVASQIDGDDLSGFNKIGYQLGLIGGYSFTNTHWMVLELQHATFGSSKRNEDVDMNLEIDMRSVNVMAAYSIRFGDSWDGFRKFRVLLGPKYHRVLDATSSLVDENLLKQDFIAAHLGFSYVISESFLIDLAYTHSVINLLNEPVPATDTLVPYYLALSLTYYVFK